MEGKTDPRRSRGSMSTDPIIPLLEAAAGAAGASTYVAVVRERVERALDDTTAPMAWESVPLAAFDRPLPSEIRSCWVFVIRAAVTTGAERHPNSHQRSRSLKGGGDFQLREGRRWETYPLISDADAPPERRWVSIPASTWHRLSVGAEHWAMLSFHTVPADELIEECPVGPNGLDGGPTQQHRYQSKE